MDNRKGSPMLDLNIPQAVEHSRARPAFALAVEALALRAVLDDVTGFIDTLMVGTVTGVADEDLATPLLEVLVSIRLRVSTGIAVATDIVETMR